MDQKGFFKYSSGRLLMGGCFLIIITKLIALQGFKLRDSQREMKGVLLYL